MFGTHDLVLFVVSGILLNITPGADTLYIVSRSAASGAKAGAVAALGIGAGCFVHIFAAALGLSAILAASATAFLVVKLVGAAYLVYLGVAMLRSGATHAAPAAPPPAAPMSRVFAQGVLTNVLNPKVALFFLAFLPQFIDSGTPDKVIAFLFLGLVFNINGTLWNLLVARIAATAGHRFRLAARAARWLQRAVGSAFVALGVKLALSERVSG
ncbi:MAG: LysE family translocator [Betaproteobacteria bacterium]|nr:MAG: LysE family translocator [Betaproteobacteria bacterium]